MTLAKEYLINNKSTQTKRKTVMTMKSCFESLMQHKVMMVLCVIALLGLAGFAVAEVVKHKEQPIDEVNYAASQNMQAATHDETQREDFWRHVKHLEKKGNWKYVFLSISNELDCRWSEKTFDEVLDYVQDVMRKLDRRFDHSTRPVFIVPESGSRKEKDRAARSQSFNLADKDKAIETAEVYDLLRDNMKKYFRMLEKYHTFYTNNGDHASRNRILELETKANGIKDELIKQRCIFMSFAVVEPAVAEAEKYVFLARGKWWKLNSPDYGRLQEAILQMSHTFNNKWLYESDEYTRFHFFRVLKKLKEMSAKRRWEDFIVLSTLSDSWDSSKYRGANAWWDGIYSK